MRLQQLKSRLLGRTPSSGLSSRQGSSDSSHLTREPAYAPSATSGSASGEPRREKFGLFELSPRDTSKVPSAAENYCVDIIAVHGLNGDAFSTWRHQPDGTLWLRDLLPQFLPGCRVYTYGYPAKVFSESKARVQGCARDLLVSIEQLHKDTLRVFQLDPLYLCESDRRTRESALLYSYATASGG